MDLNTFWFILIVILFIGFFFLEGFDYGVGILLPFVGRNEKERSVVISSIGPFWDANEVWLLTAGGAIFAAFPNWYATMFSAFYLALVVMLVALILRGVAFEFRNREENETWRKFWDWAIFGGSLVPALLWGVAIANVLAGIKIDAKKQYIGTFFDLLTPYTLLGGLAFVALFALHGGIFLTLKTEGEILERAYKFTWYAYVPAVILVAGFVIAGYFATDIFKGLGINPGVPAVGAAATLLASGYFVKIRHSGWGFIMTGLTIVLATLAMFQGLYPRVLISNIDPKNSLTVYNASSSDYTLGVMSWVAISFVPIMVLYQGWNYWVFRKRVSTKSHGHL
jgi:cytochrome d ubiquinol oxidase subunit II